MNFRYSLVFAMLILSACNGSDSSTSPVETSAATFDALPITTVPPVTAPVAGNDDVLDKQITLAVQNALLARGDEKTSGEGASADKIADLVTAVLEKLGTVQKLSPDAGKSGANDQLAYQIAAALRSVLDQRDAIARFEAKRKADTSKWAIAIEKADKLKSDGKQAEAQEVLDAAHYGIVAGEERFVSDPNVYEGDGDSHVPLSAVDEAPSVRHHKMTIGGKTVWFTAKSGHLIAYAPKDPKQPDRKDAQASIFYTAYTRDDLLAEQRPVTFFFNGGPGSSSIWLHLGSWAPKRLLVDAPNVPAEYTKYSPEHFPMVDDAETLLDRSDLVFVDPVGTGWSEAIAPHLNRQYWDMDTDAQVNVDFVRRYVNVNKRQTSPKYLYGESYGGIRVPIMARIMTEAGSTNYDPSPTGAEPGSVVLTGMILNSPILDYSTSKYGPGRFPTLAMTADFFGMAKARGALSVDDFVESTRRFSKDRFAKIYPLLADEKKRSEYLETPDGATLLNELYKFTGLGGCDPTANLLFANLGAGLSGGCYLAKNPWVTSPEFSPEMSPAYALSKLIPDRTFNAYDLRMNSSNNYEEKGFSNAIAPYLREHVNYTNNSPYKAIPDNPFYSWEYSRDSSVKYWKSSISDLIIAMSHEQKLLIVGGYHDSVTPFFQTELDLEGSGIWEKYYSVKWFDGGHMTYLTEASRAPLKKTLDDFYASSHYDSVLMCCRAVR